MALKGMALKSLVMKLGTGMLSGMLFLVVGWFAGGIFESMAIFDTLPWQEAVAFFGMLIGFILGTQIDD